MRFLTTADELEMLYGDAAPTAIRKETDLVTDEYRRLIEVAPFMVMATAGNGGLDCSPKGDTPGFVRVLDEHTLAIPDRRGNNRLDGLRNLLQDPRIALLFLIPGIGETLRVNGTARITTDEELRCSMAANVTPPAVVTVVNVESVYYHCSRAILRSDLWSVAAHVDRASLPTPGRILQALTCGDMEATAVDTHYDRTVETLF